MNKAFIIGNLTRDTEHGQTSGGVSYCRFNVAVNRPFTDQNGKREADFFNVVAWRTLADNCARYLLKGKRAAVFGHLETRSYVASDGSKRYVTEIVASEVEFLSPAKIDDSTAQYIPIDENFEYPDILK